jgi:putative dimethyl sulfoxide reductase chaperone
MYTIGGASMLPKTYEAMDSKSFPIQNDSGFSLQPILEARIFAYDFLRRVFLEEPSKDLLRNLIQNQLALVFPFREENFEIAEGTQKVQFYLEEKDILTETEYEKLHWDYTRLFIGPYELPAPPWESAYLNKDKLLFQEETRRVRLAYLKYAFLPKHYQQEADDHLGLELDFMYQLSSMAYEKAKVGESKEFKEILNDQMDFLKQHLGQWTPAFTDNVLSHSGTEFYRGMAQILRGYLQIDLIALQELLGSDF